MGSNTFYQYRDTGMQNGAKALPQIFILQSLITILHTCVLTIVKCISMQNFIKIYHVVQEL